MDRDTAENQATFELRKLFKEDGIQNPWNHGSSLEFKIMDLFGRAWDAGYFEKENEMEDIEKKLDAIIKKAEEQFRRDLQDTRARATAEFQDALKEHEIKRSGGVDVTDADHVMVGEINVPYLCTHQVIALRLGNFQDVRKEVGEVREGKYRAFVIIHRIDG